MRITDNARRRLWQQQQQSRTSKGKATEDCAQPKTKSWTQDGPQHGQQPSRGRLWAGYQPAATRKAGKDQRGQPRSSRLCQCWAVRRMLGIRVRKKGNKSGTELGAASTAEAERS